MKKLLKIQKNKGMTHSMFSQCHPEYSRGMTYVELIVVLAIFAVMSSIIIFNYGKFQAKVDIKNLASDIALQIVQAQKSSLNGALPSRTLSVNWKPAYGVYFNSNVVGSGGADNKDFIYFTDLNQDGIFDTVSGCTTSSECLNKISITKGNTISGFTVNGAGCPAITDLTVLFKRTDPSAEITSTTAPTLASCGFSYVQINITSPQATTAIIKIYPSGRIQVN